MDWKKENAHEYADQLLIEGVCCKGYGLIPKAVMRDPDLSITAKAIYAYFAAMSGSGNSTFPSMKTILEHLHFNKDTYFKHREQLTAQGYVLVQNERCGGEFTVNTYTLASAPKKYTEMTPQNEWQNELISTIEQEGLKSAGYGIIPKAVMQDPRMDTSAKAIYAYFASYAGAGRVAFPPVPQICMDLGISSGTYQKRIKLLQELGYIEVRQNNWTAGKQKHGFGSNQYILKDNPLPLSYHKISETVKSETLDSEAQQSETQISERTNNNFKTINNKSKNTAYIKNISRSISRPQPNKPKETIDKIENHLSAEQEYIDYFQKQKEYILLSKSASALELRRIDEAILLIASVCSQPPGSYVRIGRERKDIEEVRNRLLNLTIDHIVYALNSFQKRCSTDAAPIQNVRAYMLTTLYRTPETFESSNLTN